MSVKTMTSDQIQGDLEAISRIWPSGVPPEQTDRVNALKGELKRRGETVRAATRQPPAAQTNGQPKSIAGMSDDQLAKELQNLSNAIGTDPNDDALQERFADVRFEMRKRAKAAKEEPAVPTSPSVTPRAIEIPEEEPAKGSLFSEASEKRAKSASAAPASSVKGFTAQLTPQGVIVKYTAQDSNGTIVQIANRFTSEEFDALVAMFMSQTTVA